MTYKPGKIISLVLIALLLVAGAAALWRPAQPAPEGQQARQAQTELLQAQGKAFYAPEAEENPAEEGEFLLSVGDFWALRVAYPTGVFDQQWLVDAAAADQLIQAKLPAGTHDRPQSGGNLDPNQFTSLGPHPLQSLNYGIVAGRTNVIASDPVSPTIAYIGSVGGGVWKTENCCDANTTWTVMTDDPLIANTAIGDLTLDPNDHNTIYAGTGDLRFGSWSFGSAGVLKSTDAGLTWEVLGADVFGPPYTQPPNTFPQYQAIGKVRVDPRNSNTVVVTTKTGVFFSYDAGANWSGPCLTNAHATQRQDGTGLILHDNGASTDVYVAIGTRGQPTPVQPDLDQTGANGIYRATMPTSGCPAVGDWTLLTRGDNGWPAGTGNGNPGGVVGRIDMAMAPSDPDVIYAAAADTFLNNGLLAIYRTDDGGVSWVQGTNNDGGSAQNWWNQNVIVDPTDPMTIFVDIIDIWRSTDGGATVTNITQGYGAGDVVHVDQHGLAYVDNDPDRLLASNDGGIYYTGVATDPNLDYSDFIRLNATLNTIEFYAGDISGNFNFSNAPAANGGAQDNGSMVKVWDVAGGEPVGPAAWQETTGGDGMFARIEPKLAQNWYQEYQNGYIRRSTTGPYGYYALLSRVWGSDRLSFIMPYELDKYNCPGAICDHMILGTHRVWESINAGTNFYVNSPDLTKNTLGPRSFIQQLNYAVSDGSVAIVGTLDGNVQYGFGLGQGTANSATWVNVTGGNTVLPNRPIMDVATHPTVPTIGFAAIGGFDQNTPGTPGHVYQVTCSSNCSAFTWENKSGNLPNIPVNSIIANPNMPTQVFAGTDWGLYFTDDITAVSPTWNLFTAGLPRVMIWDMVIDRGFTTLALFTRARGAYVWPLPAAPYLATLDDSSASGLNGTSVVHAFTLANIGTENDAYTLSVADHVWPTTILTSSPISVSTGMTVAVEVQVDIPAAAYGGDVDGFTLTAVSVNDPAAQAAGTGDTTVDSVAGIATADPAGQSGNQGQTVTYTVTLTNTGNVTDTFAVDIGAANWPVTATATAVGPLAPNASGSFEVTVTIGAGVTDTVAITLTSGADDTVTAVVTLTTTAEGSSNTYIYLPAILKPEG